MDEELLAYLEEMAAMRPEQRRLARMRARVEALQSAPMPTMQFTPGGPGVPQLAVPDKYGPMLAGLQQVAGAFGDYLVGQRERDFDARRMQAFEKLRQRVTRPAEAGFRRFAPYGDPLNDLDY